MTRTITEHWERLRGRYGAKTAAGILAVALLAPGGLLLAPAICATIDSARILYHSKG